MEDTEDKKEENKEAPVNVGPNEVVLDNNGELCFGGSYLWDGSTRFSIGDKVKVFGLKSKEKWNNKIGEIIGEYVASSKRWPVSLLNSKNEKTGNVALLRHYNLLLHPSPFEIKLVPKENDNDNDKDKKSESESDGKDSNNENDNENDEIAQNKVGQGWFATRDIPIGSLIFVEKPLFTCNNKHGNNNQYIKEVCKAYYALNSHEKELFNSLHNRSEPKKGTTIQDFEKTFGLPATPVSQTFKENQIYQRYLTNAIVLEMDGKEDGFDGRNFGNKSMKSRLMNDGINDENNMYSNEPLTRTQRNFDTNTRDKSGIFVQLARINHSCHPNSRWFWSKSNECEILIATQFINKGDEITCDYISIHNKLYDIRRKALARQSKFYCKCDYCKNNKKTDKLIAKFNKLYNKAFTALNNGKNKDNFQSMTENDFIDVLKCEETLLNLIINKMNCDTEYLWVILHSACEVCMMKGDILKGSQYLEKSIEWFWNDRGIIAFEDHRDGLPQYTEVVKYIRFGFKNFEKYLKSPKMKSIGPVGPANKPNKKKQKK